MKGHENETKRLYQESVVTRIFELIEKKETHQVV